MAAHSYAQPSDVYRVSGLGALAFVTRPRPIDARAGDSFDPATGTFTLIGHGYTADDLLRLVLVAAGQLPSGALAAPYHVLPLDDFRFRLSLTQGGAAVTFADIGGGWGVQVAPSPRILSVARDCTAIIDECLTAHATPLVADPITGYPSVVVGLCARMTARRCLPTMAGENPAVRSALDRLNASAAFDGDTDPPAAKGSLLGDWKEGKPIAPRPVDQTTYPDNAAMAGRDREPTTWRTGAL